MVKDYWRIRKTRGKVGNLIQLRMVDPSIKSETDASETSESFAEARLREHSWTRRCFVHALIFNDLVPLLG